MAVICLARLACEPCLPRKLCCFLILTLMSAWHRRCPFDIVPPLNVVARTVWLPFRPGGLG